MKTLKEILNLKRLSGILFYTSIISFIIAFNFSDNPPVSGWQQQFMPFLNNMPLADITFLDSLTGYAVTGNSIGDIDTDYVLKTTNAGFNWSIIFSTINDFRDFRRVMFLNPDTGYVLYGDRVLRTTNAGLNWGDIFVPPDNYGFKDIYAISYDTMWISVVNFQDLIYRTTNAGLNWTRQLQGNSFDKLYFFNNRIGFCGSEDYTLLLKTTNSGNNWIQLNGQTGFINMYLSDSLNGWKVSGVMRKTTNGGINWVIQPIPSVGGSIQFPNNQKRAILYRSTNGGENWLYQITDTTIHLVQYYFVNFVNKLNGWAYVPESSGIHTTIGGDTTFYTGIQQSVGVIPKDFILKQNYPNPFNPRTVIPFSLKKNAFVKLIAYDIRGIEVQRLAEGRYNAGEYEVDFMGKFSSSGVYFYKIEITTDNSNEIYKDTKRMILLK